MKVAVLQHDIVWEDGAATRASLERPIADAAAAGARLVVVTEMYATGFSMATGRISEPSGGPNESFLVQQATTHGVWLAGSVSQADPPARPRNVGLLVSPAGEVHRYAKIHPFTHAREHEHYEAGEKTLTVEVEGVRVSLFICYDLRFADSFWGLAPETDCYVVVANWPAARREHWKALLIARAVENQAYVVGANRVGEAPKGLAYAGDSAVVDPLGRTLTAAAEDPAVLYAEIDPDRVRRVRAEFPFLQDRT